MATYAIGDVHGCKAELLRLLAQFAFDPRKDRLWFTGDLVNRGPDSLGVLRFVRDLGERAVVVLGNHDLHLLARMAGLAQARRRDSLEAVLAAPDRDDLVSWLRTRPLLHAEGDFLLVHAGIHPAWTIEDAVRLATEVEEGLSDPRSDRWSRWVDPAEELPTAWSADLGRRARRRFGIAALTRMRILDREGRLVFGFAGSPSDAPPGTHPWFEHGGPRRDSTTTILFGHWAALGFFRGEGVLCLDSGCAWGRELTALRLDDGAVFREAASPLTAG
jgi:bis(5'-nucleosyl)-tetraphosphatase (symmetrical)